MIFFSVLSIPLLQAGVRKDGLKHNPAVVIINEAMSKEYWPGRSPIGQYLNIFDGQKNPKRIIGLVANVRDASVDHLRAEIMFRIGRSPPLLFSC